MKNKRMDLQCGAIGAAFLALVGLAPLPVGAQGGPASTMPPGHPPMSAPSTVPKKAEPAKPVKLVDINSAGRAELKTLPGIGDAEAGKIIAARPYLSKADLVSRKVLPEGVYVSLKDQIIARQPGSKPAAKK